MVFTVDNHLIIHPAAKRFQGGYPLENPPRNASYLTAAAVSATLSKRVAPIVGVYKLRL